MMALALARGVVWCFMKFVNVFYVPLFVIRLFQNAKPCPPIYNPILLENATSLAAKIRRKEVTSEAVVKAYISRVQEVNPVINAVVDERYAEALLEAKEADTLVSSQTMTEEELRNRYPLLGVPVSVKESIAVKGMKNNAGRICDRSNASEDADIVRLIRDAGAIPFVVSNTPELCLNWETYNHATGRTLNPYDTRKTAGGSSGGEASLLASAGSVIGLGSDICGSLRLPAHFCGVWGHKPSPRTVSLAGHYPDCEDKEAWNSYFALGPMARYAVDLPVVLDAIVKPEYKEVLRLKEEVNLADVNIFYAESINCMFTSDIDAEILHGIKGVIQHMEKKYGAKSRKFDIPYQKYIPDLTFLNLLLECQEVDYICEPASGQYWKELLKFLAVQSKSTASTILFGSFVTLLKKVPLERREEIKEKLEEVKDEFLNALGDNGVLLLPCFPSAAHSHHDIYRKVFNCSYLSIFNSLGLPATACTLGVNSKGLPVGIQVTAGPNCDRLSLAMAQEIEKAFGGWTPPNGIKR